MAVRIQMTAMPQLGGVVQRVRRGGVGVGRRGLFVCRQRPGHPKPCDTLIATAASGLIGAVTFSGSLVAFGKLQELKFVKDIRFPGQQVLNLILALASLGLAGWLVDLAGECEYWRIG